MTPGSIRYSIRNGFRNLAFVDWGDARSPVVLCVHGLTRNARDFDWLAEALCDRYRVIAVDLPGRGGSEWLDSGAAYEMPTYVAALSHLLAWIGRPVAWVGTSLGGLCGMAVAAMHGNPITALVLNDIGPFVPAAALGRIQAYLAAAPDRLVDIAAVEARLREVHAPFGRLTDAQWAHLARHSVRPMPDGAVALHYDPALAEPIMAATPQDLDLWPFWAAISAPRLVLRGAESDLLLPEIFARMGREGAALHEVPDCGHAPALADAPTIARIRTFLDEARVPIS